MATITKTRLIKIGNSQGIRIPKMLLDQLAFEDELELLVDEDQLIIRPIRAPREGWGEQFARMHQQGDDQLLDDTLLLTDIEEEEWEW